MLRSTAILTNERTNVSETEQKEEETEEEETEEETEEEEEEFLFCECSNGHADIGHAKKNKIYK
jgi:hypothetical protein